MGREVNMTKRLKDYSVLKRKSRGKEEKGQKRKGRFSASNKTVQVGNSDYCANLQAGV